MLIPTVNYHHGQLVLSFIEVQNDAIVTVHYRPADAGDGTASDSRPDSDTGPSLR